MKFSDQTCRGNGRVETNGGSMRVEPEKASDSCVNGSHEDVVGIGNAPMNGATNSMEVRNSESTRAPPYEPIAIIGCAMRLPGGVSDSEALWNLLEGKREGRCRVPQDRYNVDAFHGPGKQGHVCTEYGYVVNGVRHHMDYSLH